MAQMNLIDVAQEAARAAGKILATHFGKKHKIAYKNRHTIVTKFDVMAENVILGILRKDFSRHSFFSEEVGLIQGDSDFLWVIDPLDGTTNFAQGFPHFCISIAFYYQKEPCAAVVYNPMTKEMFTAEARGGAYLNGKKIAVHPATDLSKTIIMVNRAAELREKIRCGMIFAYLTPHVRTIRIHGATALDLCHIACGRIDAMVNGGCEHYDCAAGNLIASEAGARVTNLFGTPWKLEKSDLLVANPVIHQSLLEIFERPEFFLLR